MKTFAAGLASFLVLDGLWLGLVMGGFYRTQLGALARLGPDGSLAPNWAAAAPVYLLLALGVQQLVLPRAGGSMSAAAGWGAVFGLVVYGVYDLTNLSTLKNYTAALTVVDIVWGMFASAAAASVMTCVSGAK